MCFEYDSYGTVLDESIRKARKEHKCTECWKPINRGESYEHVCGVWDGEMEVYKTCDRCLQIREKIYKHEIAEGCSPSHAQPPFMAVLESAREMNLI